MAIAHVQPNTVARAVHQNELIDQSNANADLVANHTGRLDADHNRLTTLENRTTHDRQGNTALGDRVETVEQRTTNGTTGNTALGNRVSTLESLPPGTGDGEGSPGGPAYGRVTRTASAPQQLSSNVSNTIVQFGREVDPAVGVDYANSVFTFTRYGRWYLAATVAFSMLPAPGAAFALRFKELASGNNYGQNTSSVTNTGFGAGTAISWSLNIQAGNNRFSVEMPLNGPAGTYRIAGDSRTALTAVYQGPV